MPHTGWRRADKGLFVSTSCKIIMSIYFQAAPAATDFSRLKRSGFTRDIMSRVSTVLLMSSLPTSRFTVFRLSTFLFFTTVSASTAARLDSQRQVNSTQPQPPADFSVKTSFHRLLLPATHRNDRTQRSGAADPIVPSRD